MVEDDPFQANDDQLDPLLADGALSLAQFEMHLALYRSLVYEQHNPANYFCPTPIPESLP